MNHILYWREIGNKETDLKIFNNNNSISDSDKCNGKIPKRIEELWESMGMVARHAVLSKMLFRKISLRRLHLIHEHMGIQEVRETRTY